MAKRYVAGFLINQSRTSVLLIRKNRPAWQMDRLNGVGGKVEPGEATAEAMTREFDEEADCLIAPEKWDHLCTIEWNDDVARVADAEPSSVAFFRHVWTGPEEWPKVRSMTDEMLEVWQLDQLPRCELIPNLTWLLPLAFYTADQYESFTLRARVAEELAS